MTHKAPLTCPGCGNKSEVTNTRYGRRDDCEACGLSSWGGKPLVDSETRNARQAAHDAFDRLWKEGLLDRSEAYRLLASELGLTTDECHMARMDKETALRVPQAAAAIERQHNS